MAITDTDIKKLKTIFATKDDLKGFATKDDLKRFATKDDLKGFATKDDLKRFATKDDLKRFATKDDLKNSINNVMNKLDEMLGVLRRNDDELTFTKHRVYNDHSPQLDDHEKRISRLEKTLALR